MIIFINLMGFLMISGKICDNLFNEMENKGNYIFGLDMWNLL